MNSGNNYVVRPNMWGRAYLPRLRVGDLQVHDRIQTTTTTDLEAEVEMKVEGFNDAVAPALRVERGSVDLATNNPATVVFDQAFDNAPHVGLTPHAEATVWLVSLNSSQGQYTGFTVQASGYAVDPPVVDYFVIG
jgi:hypothetical protein